MTWPITLAVTCLLFTGAVGLQESDPDDERTIRVGEDIMIQMRGLVSNQTMIRHGRSRNHFSRNKKTSGEILRHVDHHYSNVDNYMFADDSGGVDAKLTSLMSPQEPMSEVLINKEASPPPESPPPPPYSQLSGPGGSSKQDKYHLSSFFGITSRPESSLPQNNKSHYAQKMADDDNSNSHYQTTTESTQIYFPAHATKSSPKSSMEGVQKFIDLKNKKKEEAAKISEFADMQTTDLPDSELDALAYPEDLDENLGEDGTLKIQGHADIVTRFLRIVESQHLLGENCTAGTDLNLGEGVVDRYAQERFRVEADVAVNRANMLTRLWKYAGPSVMHSEYLLHASVFSMVEFDDDIFAAGNCYDQYQYKDYQLFCPFAYRLPEGQILVKDLAVEYKYLSNTSEWFYIARKNAENVIRNFNQFSRGYNTYTYNESAHTERVSDEILSVTYDDGKWSKPYYDCGGGNIWMLTYTVPFFGYANDSYFFKGTSGIDIDLRRVDIDQCPLQSGSTQLNIFAATDKCKKRTTECVPLPGLGFRRGSYKCVCKRGFYFPDILAEHRFYNGTVIEEEYEKLIIGEASRYGARGIFECLPCAEGCEACVDNSPCVVSLNWVIRSVILVLTCIVIGCLPAVLFFTWKYENVKVVRAASPVLLRVITLGAFLIYCTNIVMYPNPTVYTCTIRVWLREIGFCLTYGALMLKTWRISVIFRVRSAKAVKITDLNLLKRLGVIVAVFSVFLVIKTLVAPPIVIVGRTATDLKAYLCKTDWWDHSFTMLEVIFQIWGIRLCIVVRKAPSEFNESKFISMAIYNEFLLSVFLNISMFFLQSPANPDLLYIIFFCHTQLTITLLLCFIFGSKAYMVFKGHGKGEQDGSSMVAKTPAGKFISKQRHGANSQYATSTNSSSAGLNEYTKVTEQDIQEEFRRLYSQLEQLKDKNMRHGNRHLTAKISAMQEAAARQDSMGGLKEENEGSKKNKDSRLNNMFNAMADKLSCSAITPAEESSSSGREYIVEAYDNAQTTTTKNKKLNVTFSPVKTSDIENGVSNKPSADDKSNNVSSQNPLDISKDSKANGCDNCVNNIENQSEVVIDENNKSTENSGAKTGSPGSSNDNASPGSSSGKKQIKSGHARTHAIVINLDDKSRFTEEVTV